MKFRDFEAYKLAQLKQLEKMCMKEQDGLSLELEMEPSDWNEQLDFSTTDLEEET